MQAGESGAELKPGKPLARKRRSGSITSLLADRCRTRRPGGWPESRRSAFINTAFYKRQDAFDQIEACGGFSQNNVTYNTDYLVVGYYRRNSIHGEKSNMTRLAEKYNRQGKKIAIIREDEFLGMLWQTS